MCDYVTAMTNNEFSKLLDKKLVGVATKKDLDLVREDIGILKKDAKNFATKDDLKSLVTKEDAKNFATRKDLNLVKKDLEAVRGDVQKVEFQLKLTERRFEQKLEDTFSKYMKEMLDKFDRVINELQMIREENVFRQAQFERLVERVERLEQHAGLQPLL